MEMFTQIPLWIYFCVAFTVLYIIIDYRNNNSKSNSITINGDKVEINGEPLDIDGTLVNITMVNGALKEATIVKNGKIIGEIKNDKIIYFNFKTNKSNIGQKD